MQRDAKVNMKKPEKGTSPEEFSFRALKDGPSRAITDKSQNLYTDLYIEEFMWLDTAPDSLYRNAESNGEVKSTNSPQAIQ